MSSATSLEIVIAVVFLLALLLPMTFGTHVSATRSALDVLSGFSKFNLSLSTLLLGPAIGLGLVVVVYSDASLPRVSTIAVLAAVILLEAAALTVGARRRGRPLSQSKGDGQNDGVDYASRMKRLEDEIATSSPPRHRVDEPH